jgi:hypothetical protein
MLTVVENVSEKAAAQRHFNALLGEAWREREHRTVVWRPSSLPAEIFHNGVLFYASVRPGVHEGVERFWNPLGLYRSSGGLSITAEVNVESRSNSRRVSAFFARDSQTQALYLMHDGAIGGGYPGVGREGFLSWSHLQPVEAQESTGGSRMAVIVAPLRRGALAPAVTTFVNRVAEFKQTVRDGGIPSDATARADREQYAAYLREFSGVKRGARARELAYISRHGDIVEALKQWRDTAADPDERIFNTGFIDLGVQIRGKVTEVYEVKTSTSRQHLYTALGQLITHSTDGSASKRFLVLPAGEQVPEDIRKALKALCIGVLRFSFHGDTVSLRRE